MTQASNNEQPMAQSQAASPPPRLRIGSRLLEDAYSSAGVCLLRAGNRITSVLQLSRLLEPGVRFGPDRSAEVPLDLENEIEQEKEAAEREKAASTPEKRLEQAAVLRSEAVTAITDVFSRVEATGKVDVVRAEQTVSSLVSELLRNGDSLLNLVQLKDADAYTYTHSVNVSILSMYLALNTKYQKYVEAIGTGALLHDIGKVRIPPEVLRKDGPLDESERRMIRQHPEFGAQLLLDSGCCADITLSCVLDHHEKATGCGYPRGKRDTDISPFARITCLADIYDALTTDRPYRKAMSPRDAVLLMSRQMRSDLDPLFLNRLIAAVGCFTEVGAAQSNKNAGLTAPSQPIKKPHRPVVQAVRSYTGIDTRC